MKIRAKCGLLFRPVFWLLLSFVYLPAGHGVVLDKAATISNRILSRWGEATFDLRAARDKVYELRFEKLDESVKTNLNEIFYVPNVQFNKSEMVGALSLLESGLQGPGSKGKSTVANSKKALANSKRGLKQSFLSAIYITVSAWSHCNNLGFDAKKLRIRGSALAKSAIQMGESSAYCDLGYIAYLEGERSAARHYFTLAKIARVACGSIGIEKLDAEESVKSFSNILAANPAINKAVVSVDVVKPVPPVEVTLEALLAAHKIVKYLEGPGSAEKQERELIVRYQAKWVNEDDMDIISFPRRYGIEYQALPMAIRYIEDTKMLTTAAGYSFLGTLYTKLSSIGVFDLHPLKKQWATLEELRRQAFIHIGHSIRNGIDISYCDRGYLKFLDRDYKGALADFAQAQASSSLVAQRCGQQGMDFVEKNLPKENKAAQVPSIDYAYDYFTLPSSVEPKAEADLNAAASCEYNYIDSKTNEIYRSRTSDQYSKLSSIENEATSSEAMTSQSYSFTYYTVVRSNDEIGSISYSYPWTDDLQNEEEVNVIQDEKQDH